MKPTILNAAGKPITLTEAEQYHVEELAPKYNSAMKRAGIKNALGYEITITTLTTIMKKITEQKFFEMAPADYLPIRVGEGAWSSNLVTYREFMQFDDFATGVIDTGANNGRLAQVDAGVDSVPIVVRNWAKSLGWSIFDLELAAKSGNWDIVSAKERSRKKNWDLGIQKVAFLGLSGDAQVLGLLNQATIQNASPQNGSQTVYSNYNSLLTTSIYKLATTPQNLSTFLAQILNVYRVNCGYSAWPTHFIIPESDYLGLATATSASFPLKSILQYMQETFQTMTGNKNFKILPCRYADGIVAGTSNQTYVLLNYAEEAIRMDIPVDYTNTLANSIDNFSFQNAGYGQFTGVKLYRNLETMYIQFPSSQA